MILMPVRQDQAAHFAGICFQIGNIRINNIYTIHVFIRKTHTCVNNNDIVQILYHSHVFSDFAKTAKRYYSYFRNHFPSLSSLYTHSV